jgi:hypothetical protein
MRGFSFRWAVLELKQKSIYIREVFSCCFILPVLRVAPCEQFDFHIYQEVFDSKGGSSKMSSRKTANGTKPSQPALLLLWTGNYL